MPIPQLIDKISQVFHLLYACSERCYTGIVPQCENCLIKIRSFLTCCKYLYRNAIYIIHALISLELTDEYGNTLWHHSRSSHTNVLTVKLMRTYSLLLDSVIALAGRCRPSNTSIGFMFLDNSIVTYFIQYFMYLEPLTQQ